MQNRKTGRAFWLKGWGFFGKRREGLFRNLREGGGAFGQTALLLPLPRAEQRRGRGRQRPWIPTSQATPAAGNRGKRGSGVRGFDSSAHLGLGRGEEAGQQEQAAAALGGSGGGARGAEKGYGGGGRSWWRKGAAVGAFYSPIRSVGWWR